jgi:hypothetical protein
MITRMTGLTGLEVQPIGVLVFIVAVMGAIVDPRGLTVRVPAMDFPATSLDLRLGAGTITTWQVDHRPSSITRHEIPAVAGIVGGRNDGPGNIKSFPAETVEHRLQDGRDAVVDQDFDDLVEVLEVVDIDLGQSAAGKIVEASSPIDVGINGSSRMRPAEPS